MHVEIERHRGVAEFPYPVHRIQAPGHSDFDHSLAECTQVRDDIDITGPDVGGPIVDVLDGGIDLGEPFLQLGGAVDIPLGVQGGERVDVVLTFLVEPCSFPVDLLLYAFEGRADLLNPLGD